MGFWDTNMGKEFVHGAPAFFDEKTQVRTANPFGD